MALLVACGAYADDAPPSDALVNKGPLLMQNMMDEMRALMRPMVQRINQIKNDSEQELKALPAHK
jgi:hypothetical protein